VLPRGQLPELARAGRDGGVKMKYQEEKTQGQKASGGIVHPCTCVNKFQDAQHGPGNRFMNVCKDGTLRCTVCATKFSK